MHLMKKYIIVKSSAWKELNQTRSFSFIQF